MTAKPIFSISVLKPFGATTTWYFGILARLILFVKGEMEDAFLDSFRILKSECDFPDDLHVKRTFEMTSRVFPFRDRRQERRSGTIPIHDVNRFHTPESKGRSPSDPNQGRVPRSRHS
jgi:hypothetical protein